MTLWVVTGWVALVFVAALGATIIWKIWTGDIDLSRLISEPTGDASMSRFQLLVFTFVVALGLLLVIVSGETPSFPEVIPGSVLALLGISASSYLVSKGIQFSSDEGGRHKEGKGGGGAAAGGESGAGPGTGARGGNAGGGR
jgi:uncharacterized BrkB/YihY/UPF0761 family membrane protein